MTIRMTLRCTGVPIDLRGVSASRLLQRGGDCPCRIDDVVAPIGDAFEIDIASDGPSKRRIEIFGDDLSDVHRVGGAGDDDATGIDGDEIWVAGAVGAMTGHRMRRGLIVVAGDAGDCTGANMIAGTILVAGRVGDHAMAGARRGTLITGHPPTLSPHAWTRPVRCENHWLNYFANAIDVPDEGFTEFSDALQRMARGAVHRRGDRVVDGLAEIIYC